MAGETDQRDAVDSVTFPEELTDVHHPVSRHVGPPGVSHVGVVLPDESSRGGTVVLSDPLDGVGHVVVADVPGVRSPRIMIR